MKLFYSLICVLCLSACQKEAATPDAKAGGTDFIEFKLDGTLHRLENNVSINTSVVTLSNTPALPLYQLIHVLYSGQLKQQATVHLISSQSIQVKKYEFSSFDVSNRPSFMFLDTPTSGYQTSGPNARGTIEITKLDTLKGGIVEGTFTLSNLDQFTQTNGIYQVLSANHKVTEGKFRATFK
ncbi:hypothetical protein LX87_05451 [Larkinella arboricola]|uniref:CHRD domain-containing protein n=1 Tax=Larkinella arboricola TaxID=643671 RepID=A0A327WH76_LARAB|nr:hypothetical protein [Larkinella arboricola]RAJ90822.1 hypothetical protein LX87_05451 [Larkinella arboricola]